MTLRLNPAASRYIEQNFEDEEAAIVITVYCMECGDEIGDYFETELYPEYCEICDPEGETF